MLKIEGEEVISAQKIDLHSLPTDILEVLSPLLCEMEELGTTLNLEEFLDAALRLYNVRLDCFIRLIVVKHPRAKLDP